MSTGKIRAATIKKLVILKAIDEFPRGVFGRKRLQKVIYHAVRDESLKPLTFQVDKHGQYSPDLDNLLRELEVDGLVETMPLPRGQGKGYTLTEGARSCLSILDKILPGYTAALKKARDKVGFMSDPELNKWAKSQLEMEGKRTGDVLFEENLPVEIEPSLTASQCEDIELALNTDFIPSALKVIEGLQLVECDLSPLQRWDGTGSVQTAHP